jgi:hypothetical protein
MENQGEEPEEPAGDESDAQGPDELEEREARARRLREDIERIKSGGPPAGEEPPGAESPREFVERRMRELETGEKDDPDEGSGPD